jgi:hypothetical protein
MIDPSWQADTIPTSKGLAKEFLLGKEEGRTTMW